MEDSNSNSDVHSDASNGDLVSLSSREDLEGNAISSRSNAYLVGEGGSNFVNAKSSALPHLEISNRNCPAEHRPESGRSMNGVYPWGHSSSTQHWGGHNAESSSRAGAGSEATPTRLSSFGGFSVRDQQIFSAVTLCLKSIKECVKQFSEESQQHIGSLGDGVNDCLSNFGLRDRGQISSLIIRKASTDVLGTDSCGRNSDDTLESNEAYAQKDNDIFLTSSNSVQSKDDYDFATGSSRLDFTSNYGGLQSNLKLGISRLLSGCTTRRDVQDGYIALESLLPAAVSLVERQLDRVLKNLGHAVQNALHIFTVSQTHYQDIKRKYELQCDVVEDLEKQLVDTRTLSSVNHTLEQKLQSLEKENKSLLQRLKSCNADCAATFPGMDKDVPRSQLSGNRSERLEDENEMCHLKAEILDLTAEIARLKHDNHKIQYYSEQGRSYGEEVYHDPSAPESEDYDEMFIENLAKDLRLSISQDEVASYYARFEEYLHFRLKESVAGHSVSALRQECFALWLQCYRSNQCSMRLGSGAGCVRESSLATELPAEKIDASPRHLLKELDDTIRPKASADQACTEHKTRESALQEVIMQLKARGEKLEREQECIARVANTRLQSFQDDLGVMVDGFVHCLQKFKVHKDSGLVLDISERLSPDTAQLLCKEIERSLLEANADQDMSLPETATDSQNLCRSTHLQPPRRLYRWRLQNYVATNPTAVLTGRNSTIDLQDQPPQLHSPRPKHANSSAVQRLGASASLTHPVLQWLNGGR